MAASKKARQPYSQDVTKYAVDAFLITPDDNSELSQITRGICFGKAGTLRILTEDGTDITIPNRALAVGAIHPLGVRKVFSTGTSATDIVGFV